MKRKFYLKRASGNNFLLLLAVLVLTCCAEKKTPREVLVKTYVENIIAEEAYFNNADSLRVHREKIFKDNGISRQLFLDGLKKLQSEPGAWDLFFKEASDMLDSLRRAGKIS